MYGSVYHGNGVTSNYHKFAALGTSLVIDKLGRKGKADVYVVTTTWPRGVVDERPILLSSYKW